MYSRKWTRMSWWHSTKYLKKYGLIETPLEYPIFHQFPPTNHYEGSFTKSKQENNKDYSLIGKLLNKYPELQHVPLNRDIKNPGTTIPDTNYIFNFIKKQKSLMKQGFSEEKAFEITEKLYQQRMQRKIDQNRVARGLAINNRARSFMNLYQQQAEYEARLKVLRLERDISKYEQARVDFKKKLEEWEEEEEEEESLNKSQEDQDAQEILQIIKENEETAQEQDEAEGRRRYTRVLERIVTSSSEGQPATNQKEIIQQFINRTKNLFNTYYDRASMLDKLSGLTDAEIKSQIRDTPSKLKKRTRLLRLKLERNGIKLNENGEVDYSKCDNLNLLRKIKGDPMVKIALMASDLHFEFPHQEEEIKKALEMRNRLEELDDENVEDPRDINARAESADDLVGGEKLEPLSKEEEKRYKEDILEKKMTEGKIYYPKEQTFRLIETYSERIKRLEKKWLQAQIAHLEAPAEETLKQRENQLKNVVNEFRRLKFKLEQEASQSAEKLLFAEHEVFSQEELQADKDFPFEKLENYLNLPQNLKRLTQKQEFEDKLIMKMITPTDIEEDLVPIGFENDYKKRLYPRDSSDYNEILLANQREEERIRNYQLNSRSEFKGIDTHEDLAEEDKLAVNEEKKGKDEKKKIVDFIKKAALKKATDGKKEEKNSTSKESGKKEKKELGQEVLKGASKKKK